MIKMQLKYNSTKHKRILKGKEAMLEMVREQAKAAKTAKAVAKVLSSSPFFVIKPSKFPPRVNL